MEIYLIPIKSALLAFPIIALAFTMPYIIFQYKKFGAIPFWRTAILYSFILYILNAYFFVILPLPPVEEVSHYTGSGAQLVPFQFVSDFMEKSSLDLSDPNTYLAALTDSSFFVVFFNLLLFVPLGIYLRYYFKSGWKKTFITSLGVSLFFELTQLTGLYGIYPRPYRMFDVDDLMLNTLGGMMGYCVTPLLVWFLPSRDRIDDMAYEKGERVPLLRRLMALLFDWLLVFLPLWLFFDRPEAIFAVILYSFLMPWVTGGYTLGKWFFRMRLVDGETGGKPGGFQYILRYSMFYGTVLVGPGAVVGCFILADRAPAMLEVLLAMLVLFVGLVWLLFIWESLGQLFGRRRDYFYGRISRTRNKNMIVRKRKRDNLRKPG